MRNIFKTDCRMMILYGSICLLALGLRLHHLDAESLFMDELLQVAYYFNSFKQLVIDAASQAQPPLDYWIGHIIHNFYDTDFALRLPAALFGTGTVLLVMLLLSKWASLPVSTGTGAIAAFSPFLLYYSQEARPYAIAIFFFLLLLYVLQRLLAAQKALPGNTCLFLLVATGFLYTRSLSPLVVICVLGAGLFLSLFFRLPSKKNVGLALAAIIFAVLLYLPNLKLVLARNAKYLPDTRMQFGWKDLSATLSRFDPFPIWQTFAVQTEPLTFPLLALLLLALVMVIRKSRQEKDGFPLLIFFVLTGSVLLEQIVFQAKTDMPFRPPYAIYLLPSVLLLAGLGFQQLLDLTHTMRSPRYTRFIIFLGGAILIAQTIFAAADCKTFPKRSDWKGLCRYLASDFGPQHVLLLDSLSPYGRWEPSYVGFPRYYRGTAQITGMMHILDMVPAKGIPLEPVVVLFQWREYYLTSRSRYPFMPVEERFKSIDYHLISQDPDLQVTEFTGFSVIRLKKPSGCFFTDTYAILQRLLQKLPDDESVIEIHLAAGAIGKGIEKAGWQWHLEKSLHLASQETLPQITKKVKAIQSSPVF